LEIGSDRRFVIAVEAVTNEPVHNRGLADRRIANDDNLKHYFLL
jgi:hypothetical protein